MPAVNRLAMLVAVVGVFLCLNSVGADSLWERRNPYYANMFWDTKARRVGDVVTIVLVETTNFQGQETRTLKKNTINTANAAMNGTWKQGGTLDHKFAGTFGSNWNSDRALSGAFHR